MNNALMKFAFTTILLAGLTFSSAFAQVKGGAPEFDKLFDMFTMDEVEDCAWKAAKMVENDKYKKMPEPYLYYSMCMLIIWEKNEDLPEDEEPEFPKPYKDCFKYAAKARKKDKSGEIVAQNSDFYDRLKDVGSKEAHWYIDDGDFKKAASEYKAVWRTDPSDANLQFMMGACEAMSRNVGAARVSLKESIIALNKNYADDSYEPNQFTEPVLEEAMIMYTDWLLSSATPQPDSAVSLITKAKAWMPDSEDMAKQADKLMN